MVRETAADIKNTEAQSQWVGRTKPYAFLIAAVSMVVGPSMPRSGAAATHRRNMDPAVRFVILGKNNKPVVTSSRHYRRQRNFVLSRGSNLTWPSDLFARLMRDGRDPSGEDGIIAILEAVRAKFQQWGKVLSPDDELLIADRIKKTRLADLLQQLDHALGDLEQTSEALLENAAILEIHTIESPAGQAQLKVRELHDDIAAVDDHIVSMIETLRDRAPKRSQETP